MSFTGFESRDFEVFEIPGLDNRMDALKEQVRPKFQEIGTVMAEYLGQLLDQPMYPHVARHARRTVNPPNDSWVAFCHDKRGYKKHPHFQIGLWQTHVFMNFGLIYESPQREHYAAQLRQHADEVLETIPDNYVWIQNHMDPDAIPATEVDTARLDALANRLARVKQGELLVGRNIPKATAVAMSGEQLLHEAQQCFALLQPLYRLAMGEVASI